MNRPNSSRGRLYDSIGTAVVGIATCTIATGILGILGQHELVTDATGNPMFLTPDTSQSAVDIMRLDRISGSAKLGTVKKQEAKRSIRDQYVSILTTDRPLIWKT